MQIETFYKKLFMAGLLLTGISPILYAADDLDAQLASIEHICPKNDATFNITAFITQLVCGGIETTVSAIPAFIMLNVAASLKNKPFTFIPSQELRAEGLFAVGRAVHKASESWQEETFPIASFAKDVVFTILPTLEFGWAVKAGIETDANTSFKENCKKAFQRGLPLAACTGAIAFVAALLELL